MGGACETHHLYQMQLMGIAGSTHPGCSRDQITSQAQCYFRTSGICRLVGRFCSVSKPRPSILRAPQNSKSPLR